MPSPNPLSAPDLNQFQTLLTRYAEYGSRAAIPMRRSPQAQAEALFSRLTPTQRTEALARLRADLANFAAMEAAGDPLADPRRQLWRYLSAARLSPRADIFDKLSSEDLLQVYGRDQTLLFVSLNFFEHVSFTLEQIFCQTWQQATRRDPAIERAVGESFRRAMNGEEAGTFDPGNPWHTVEEVGSELGFRFDLKVKWISPLHSGDNLSALLAVVGCRRPSV